eukprot:gene1257-1448_t
MTQALIELSDLGFNWPGHPQLLDIPTFRLEPGETLFLKGPSGSGKTTLLGLLGGVQKPSRGSIRLLGQELTELSAGARDRFRVDHTGYIFQQFNLLPFLSVRENVELPCHFSTLRAQRAIQRHGSVDQAAATLLAHLGLKDKSLLERRLLFAECREAGASLLFVSHDQSLAPLFDRNLSLAELNRAATPAEV